MRLIGFLFVVLVLCTGCSTIPVRYNSKADLPEGTLFFLPADMFTATIGPDWQFSPFYETPYNSNTNSDDLYNYVGSYVSVIGTFITNGPDAKAFYVAEQKTRNLNGEIIVTYFFAPKQSVVAERAQAAAERAQYEKQQAQREQAIQASNGAIVSTGGRFTVYIPFGTNNAMAARENRALFDLAESQVRNRPIAVNFACDRDRFDLFLQSWMYPNYQFIPRNNDIEVWFQDAREDQDYVIILNPLPPILNLYFMTYQYFAATH
jgi:hypothetical protein